MNANDKPIVWLHGEVKTPPFTKEARLEAEFFLRRLQEGERLEMPRSRPMPSIGSTTMREEKRKRLESKGWRVGSTREFLGLSADEEVYVELRLRLANGLKKRRLRRQLTQMDLAKIVRSSQSRVAKMESGDLTVSLDLLIRSLLALGASRKDLAQIITDSKSVPAI